MRRTLLVCFIATIALTTGCGSGGGGVTNPPKTGAGRMSARIDGGAWTAISVVANKTASINALIISGSDAALRTITVSYILTGGPGTQNIGGNAGLLATLGASGAAWTASGNNGGTGSITVSTLTANHAVGTFNFTAVGTTAPTSRQVTQGQFDVTF